MSDENVYSEPTEVTVEDDVIALDGPDGVDVKLTAEAAEETSDRLLDGVVKARGNRIMKKLPIRPK